MKTIEVFFSTHSVFAYIGHAALVTVAQQVGREVVLRPFDLRRLFDDAGHVPTGRLTDARRQYFFGREIDRWAQFRQVPILDHIPASHDCDLRLSSTVLIAAMQAGHDGVALAGEMLRAHWVEGADLADADAVSAMLNKVGMEAAPLLSAAESISAQQAYDANTDAAIAMPMFGSPTYLVDGDMFYGQDRLEQVAQACTTPFAKRWA